jgi:hypothetical protein
VRYYHYNNAQYFVYSGWIQRKPRIHRFSVDTTWFTETLVHSCSYVGYIRLLLGSVLFKCDSRRGAGFFSLIVCTRRVSVLTLFPRVEQWKLIYSRDKLVSEFHWLPSLGSETTLVVVTSRSSRPKHFH